MAVVCSLVHMVHGANVRNWGRVFCLAVPINTAITPPMVPGLEFEAVAQPQRVESVNGVTRSTSAVTYQVSASQSGDFTIPSGGARSKPLVLTVTPGGSGGRAATAAAPASDNRARADGSSFVRLRLAKHNLYVGEPGVRRHD